MLRVSLLLPPYLHEFFNMVASEISRTEENTEGIVKDGLGPAAYLFSCHYTSRCDGSQMRAWCAEVFDVAK
jgi:hypothetical protein